ncbi:MAG: ATP-dependent Clp protease adaptor ClpS [Prevotella sp.]|nr:ATP-dependent Clp protease adaptor ClpS [Prevotella sp.]
MSKTSTAVKQHSTIELKEPHLYRVLLFNDDVTTMEFVVRVLRQVFHKDEKEATKLMLKVHNEGQAVVGTYTLDVAMTRVEKVRRMAKEEKFPLRIEYEKE